MNLLKLAEACERADGADRDLDALIACAIGRPLGNVSHWLHGPDISYKPTAYGYYVAVIPIEGGDTRTSEAFKARCFTESLDDARSLVPENHTWAIPGLVKPMWDARINHNDGLACMPLSQPCKTPALAICAAALRARHAMAMEGK